MRFTLALCLLSLPALSLADTIEVPSSIAQVTVYPQGATILRTVTFDAPAGRHDIIVPGLPQGTYARALRVIAPAGVTVGAVSLAAARLPVTADLTSPAVQAAKDEVERLEAVLRQRDAAIATIRLRVDAAEQQIAVLQGLAQIKSAQDVTVGDVEGIRALAQMVGDQTLVARTDALAAEQEAQTAELARQDDVEALDEARQSLAALTTPDTDGSVLTLSVLKDSDGPVSLTVTTLSEDAGWAPVYDLRLTTGDTPTLAVERGVVISQYTGEDWTDVDLTLSTARPGEQVAASRAFAYPYHIISEDELRKQSEDVYRGEAGAMTAPVMEMAPAVVVEETRAGFATAIGMMGATVTYHYGQPVRIRDQSDMLRLTLDTLDFTPEIWAAAVPSRDSSAYRVAKLTNTGTEVLLPGEAMLWADGALIGATELGLIAAGDDTEIGFGPIDGIRLTRAIPSSSEGDIGVISRSNQSTMKVVMTVDNLTREDWTIKLRDAVPYSEQDDLVITTDASPAATTVDPDNQRGILEWEIDLAAGETQQITVDQTITWPLGFVLQ
jgi:uncharacterized protein (TIGR02231 family)